MKNIKFLKQYPKLWVPKVGDRVKIVQIIDVNHIIVTNSAALKTCQYQINDIGIILHILPDIKRCAVIEFDNGVNALLFYEEFTLHIDD